jgi:hypothetical protein
MKGALSAVAFAFIAFLLCLPHSSALTQVQQAILDRHNYWRSNVNPPAGTFPLVRKFVQ